MSRLNYKHLHYFWTVAREGSIAQASEILHVTPQTISGQLSLLEESVGEKLFARSGRSLVLTEAGRVACDYAEEIFLLGRELEDLLKNQSTTGVPVSFHVGIADVVPKLIACRLLEPAMGLPEQMRIICHEDKLENLLADLAVHKLDIVLADSPMPPTMNVRAFNHLLGECGVTFFGIPALAERFRPGFPHSLNGAPMLMPTTGTTVRSSLMQWFDTLEVHPQIAGEFADSALMKSFGQSGAGIFSAPQVIAQEVMRQYQVETIGHTNEVKEQFFAISAERRIKHPAVAAVRDTARKKIFSSSAEDID
jgi:LysR family transcriptional activator of nhaA